MQALAKVGASSRGKSNQRPLPGLSSDECAVVKGYVGLQQWSADELFLAMVGEIPFATKRWNGIYKLPQKAYHYGVSARKSKPLQTVESVITRLESEYPVQVSEVWCNLFENGSHRIGWHQDQYGEHLFVLSLGAARVVQFRDLKTKQATLQLDVNHGDLYYMHPNFDKMHEHCVPAVPQSEPRVSLAIFAKDTRA